MLCAQLFHGRSSDLGEVGDAGRLVLGHVSDAQAAAHVKHLGLEAVRFLHARDELDHDLNGLAERMQRENLRADMTMEAVKLHIVEGKDVAHALEGEVVQHGETELRVLAAGFDVLVRVGLDAGGDAHQNGLDTTKLARNLGDALRLDAAVNHDVPNACGDRLAQFSGRFVVAMHENALHGEADGLGAGKLAAARHVEAHALFHRDAQHFLVKERLACIQHVGILIAGMEAVAILLHAIAQVGLVENVQGRSLLMGKLNHVDTADEQVAIANLGGFGQHRAQIHGSTLISFFIGIGCTQRHDCLAFGESKAPERLNRAQKPFRRSFFSAHSTNLPRANGAQAFPSHN